MEPWASQKSPATGRLVTDGPTDAVVLRISLKGRGEDRLWVDWYTELSQIHCFASKWNKTLRQQLQTCMASKVCFCTPVYSLDREVISTQIFSLFFIVTFYPVAYFPLACHQVLSRWAMAADSVKHTCNQLTTQGKRKDLLANSSLQSTSTNSHASVLHHVLDQSLGLLTWRCSYGWLELMATL